MDDRPERGTRTLSLRRQLVIWVLLPQLVLWVAGGFATYRLAVRYVNQAADATLSQATRALARRVKPIGNGLLIDFPRAAQEVLETDPNDRLFYMVSTPPGEFILGNNSIPMPPASMRPRLNDPYFYDGEIKSAGPAGGRGLRESMKVRIAALYLPYAAPEGKEQWMLVQVARNMAHREDIFKLILMDTLLPLSALIPLLTLIVWIGTGAGLAPLLRLRKEVEGRSPLDLAPLRIESAPQEVHSLVRALNALLASVRQNVNAQKRFIADAAHQLRTPLAGLKSQTALAIAATDDPALIARLKLVDQSATRGAHLINQLLMLARADPEAAAASDKAPLDMPAFVQEIVAEYVPRALRAQIDLGMDDAEPPAAAPLRIEANALLLREALTNVIDNAIKYTGRGGEITVRVAPDGGDVLVTVTDNGPGIPEADRARVFERFVRATDQGEGCGLGLAIVRDIVAQHGGTVELQDARPRGLRVAIRLPRR
ncbi:sensor histidine kinase [Massilia sp. CT11-108]|uniref:sensor histidine kinase n=1 Tax=Massilia sp. CT11-108 TaxID=3393900 RepID=UPI0039A724FD